MHSFAWSSFTADATLYISHETIWIRIFPQSQINQWKTAIWIHGWTKHFSFAFTMSWIIHFHVMMLKRKHLQRWQPTNNFTIKFQCKWRSDTVQFKHTKISILSIPPPYWLFSCKNIVHSHIMLSEYMIGHCNPCWNLDERYCSTTKKKTTNI